MFLVSPLQSGSDWLGVGPNFHQWEKFAEVGLSHLPLPPAAPCVPPRAVSEDWIIFHNKMPCCIDRATGEEVYNKTVSLTPHFQKKGLFCPVPPLYCSPTLPQLPRSYQFIGSLVSQSPCLPSCIHNNVFKTLDSGNALAFHTEDTLVSMAYSPLVRIPLGEDAPTGSQRGSPRRLECLVLLPVVPSQLPYPFCCSGRHTMYCQVKGLARYWRNSLLPNLWSGSNGNVQWTWQLHIICTFWPCATVP